MALALSLGYNPRPMDGLARTLRELGGALRRLALGCAFFGLRMSAMASDTPVTLMPARLVPLTRQKFSDN